MSRNHDLKEENIYKVRACFYEEEIWTKNSLAEKTGLSLAATTNVLQELLEEQEILFVGEADSTGGRKSKNYTLNVEYAHMGMLILRKEGKKHILHAYSTNLKNKNLVDFQETKEEVSKEDVVSLVKLLMEKDPKIQVLTISIPGVCENGIIDICDYAALEGEHMLESLTPFCENIIIENDVNVACIGFSYQYPEKKNLAFIYQPKEDYVGVGIVLNGKLYNGFSHFAGELRYSPFYTHDQQTQMLQENPEDLLMKQIGMLCSVINPSVVGYHSDCFKTLTTNLQTYGIPKKHCPALIPVENLELEIRRGLYSIGLNDLKENRRKEHEN